MDDEQVERENLIEGNPITVVDELLELRKLKGRLEHLRYQTALKVEVTQDMLNNPADPMNKAILDIVQKNLTAQLEELDEVLNG